MRRAIQENWSAETMLQKVDRHIEYLEENFYVRRGHSIDEAREVVQRNRRTLLKALPRIRI